VEIRVEQIAIVKGEAIVTGRPVNDATKVVVAAGAEVTSAMLLAMALQDLPEAPIVDVPDDHIVRILELPEA
jgi:hypothetical protein